MIDLRPDTVTQPTPAMREAMAAAAVGDDVYGDDPSVNLLEERLAALLGKEAGLFVPSGTMGNLIAMLAQCARGDEVITARQYHVYCDEAGGAAIVGGIMFAPLEAASDGALDAAAIADTIKPDDFHNPPSRLLCLENTHCGKAIPLARMQQAAEVARANGLKVHLDGARIFNAVRALDVSAGEFAKTADSVSVCLSKGLGAPAGSVLLGARDFIDKSRRIRKFLGGGMRQAGVLAAAGLYALDHHIDRLDDDHTRAQNLADYLNSMNALEAECATNMVFVKCADRGFGGLAETCAKHGVIITEGGENTRLVLHLGIDDAGLATIKEAFTDWLKWLPVKEKSPGQTADKGGNDDA